MSYGYSLPSAPPDEVLSYGVLSRRVFAWIIDAVIESVLLAIAWSFCLAFGLITFGLGWPIFGLLPAIPFLYTWLTVASGLSATPGMAFMGLSVRRNDDLNPPNGVEALIWTLGFFVTIALGWIWLCLAVVTTRRRTPHDIVAGLVVVRTRALTGSGRFGNMPQGGFPAA